MASNTNYAQKIDSPNLNVDSKNSINQTNTNYCKNIDTFTYDEALTEYDDNTNQTITNDMGLSVSTLPKLDTTTTQPYIVVSSNGYIFFQNPQYGLPIALQANAGQDSTFLNQLINDSLYSNPQNIGPQNIGPQNNVYSPQGPVKVQSNKQLFDNIFTFDEFDASDANSVARNAIFGSKGTYGLIQNNMNKKNGIFSVSSVYFGDEYAMKQMENVFDDARASLADDPEALALFDEVYNNYATKEKLYKNFLSMYNDLSAEYNGYQREWDALTKQMNKAFEMCETPEERVQCEKFYTEQYEDLQQKMDNCKKLLAGEDGDPSKIQIEKQYLGNTPSALKQYGKEAGTQTLVSFLIKEVSSFAAGYATSRKNGEDPDAAFDDAITKLENDSGKNFLTSAGQGTGYFGTMILTQGNKNYAGVTGLVASNAVGVGYDYFTADPSNRSDILLKGGMQIGGGAITAYGGTYVLPQLINGGVLTSTKLANGALPFSGATLYSYGSTAATIGSWFIMYDDLGDWAANVDSTEVSAMFLNMAAYTIGDGIEVYFFGRTTGTVGMILAIPATVLAEPCANFGENLGYWYYDFEKELEDFGANELYDFVQDWIKFFEDAGGTLYDINHGVTVAKAQMVSDINHEVANAVLNVYTNNTSAVSVGPNISGLPPTP